MEEKVDVKVEVNDLRLHQILDSNSNLIQQLEEKAIQASSKQIQKEAQADYNELKRNAEHYLSEVKKVQNTLENFYLFLKQSRPKRGISSPEEFRNYHAQRTAQMKLMQETNIIALTVNFQQQCFKAMGKELRIIYVNIEDKKPVMYDITEQSGLFQFDGWANTARISKGQKAFKDFAIQQHLQKLERIESDEEFNRLQNVYTEYRYRRIVKGNHTLRVMALNPNYQKGSRQDIYKRWAVQKVANLGDLAEGYAYLFFNSLNKLTGEPEHDIIEFMKAINTVDAESGALKGDITVGNIEYQIKSAGAGYSSIQDIIAVAQLIVRGKVSLEAIQEMLHQTTAGTARNGIKWVSDGKVEDVISDGLDATVTKAVKGMHRNLS